MTDLRLFDLNLLVAFDALMSERNVTRAASRVGIGQPAMSHALSRLRELLGDDLFIRSSSGMQPTARALELSAPVARILADIRESVLADRPFQPERSELVFRIGASDYAEVAILPPVLAAMRISAPMTHLAINAVDRDRVGTMLQNGDIDLAIGYFPAADGAQKSEILFHEEFVCLFDAKACGITAPLRVQTYLDLPHILMSLRGELSGSVDAALARRGAKRFVFVATPHFLAIPFLLRGFRAVAALPRRLAENCASATGLAVCPLPVDIQGFDVFMLWHVRSDADPAQRWFRDLVREAGRARAAKSALPHAPAAIISQAAQGSELSGNPGGRAAIDPRASPADNGISLLTRAPGAAAPTLTPKPGSRAVRQGCSDSRPPPPPRKKERRRGNSRRSWSNLTGKTRTDRFAAANGPRRNDAGHSQILGHYATAR